jgi:hypothetical protein
MAANVLAIPSRTASEAHRAQFEREPIDPLSRLALASLKRHVRRSEGLLAPDFSRQSLRESGSSAKAFSHGGAMDLRALKRAKNSPACDDLGLTNRRR